MRIISGNLKGKKILQPKDKFTRPLKDLTKESIFNIIEHSNLLNVKIEKSIIPLTENGNRNIIVSSNLL